MQVTHISRLDMQIMEALWCHGNLLSSEIHEFIGKEKLAYSTLSLSLRLLENKKLIAHQKLGKKYHYYTLLKKDDYLLKMIKECLDEHFSGYLEGLESFLNRNRSLLT